ncbi:MAG: SDR family oxidoreductase [Chlorobi bacterium]|nr:SDR family oxidoreductase [Chlorobiota bacterium]
MTFKGKVVWVTGATSGIGEALAYEFASLGARLIISSNQVKDLETVKENCLKKCDFCFTQPFDLESQEEIANSVKNVIDKVGNIDILINNGGISQRSKIIETPFEIDKRIMNIDYYGAVYLTKNVLPFMVKNGGGHIMVTTSIAGKFGFPLRSAYSAAKHALYGFFETLRAEHINDNIKVTIACPGRVQTNISKHALTKDGNEHGNMSQGQANGISAEKCARKMIWAIKKNKREVLIGGKELIMVYLKKFFPGIFYKLVSKIDPS